MKIILFLLFLTGCSQVVSIDNDILHTEAPESIIHEIQIDTVIIPTNCREIKDDILVYMCD
jgi:PBP1b-binding outer membrane lipoprotein LpoB